MDNTSFPVFFGEWVKKRRRLLDLTQEELAQRTGCTIFTIRKIESGERRPSKQLAELLSVSLEVPPEDRGTFMRVARGELILERLQDPSFDSPLAAFPDPQTGSVSSFIPVQPSPLIGRDSELTSMERLFNDPQCRLLSLTGMGGIGKTRLAVEYASIQRTKYGHSVGYVPLAPVQTTEAIVPAIADALGFTFSGPGDPKDQLINFLARQHKSLFLVLDNLEHLLKTPSTMEKPGIVALISELLQRIPNLKILATSRERINLQGEWTYEIHGLSVPPLDYIDRLVSYSAVALFIQKARRVKFDFNIHDADKPAVVKICQLLDGIPLSIELAAAWVGILSCQEIAQEIRSNIDFLASSIHDVPRRHQSIRASFDHSWKLLSEEERKVLSRLAVFHGGFDRTAAERIAAASLPLLASLVAKSLVRRSEGGRYDLHEVIRQYAHIYLDEDPRSLETHERHAGYYLTFTRDHEKSFRSKAQQDAVRQLTVEIDNIRAAWYWAVQNQRYSQLGMAVRSLGWYYEVAGLPREGIEELAPLIQDMKTIPIDTLELKRCYGTTLAQQALLNFRKGEIILALALYEESLPLLRSAGDPSRLAESLVFLGILQHLCGAYERAKFLLEESLALAKSCQEKWFESYAIYNLGYIASLMGDYQEGLKQMLTGLDIWRALGDDHYVALGLNFMVPTLSELGHHDQAIASMHESIALCEKTRNRWGLGTAYRFLGLATMSAGLPDEAQIHFTKSLKIYKEYVNGWDIAQTLYYLGEAKFLSGDLANSKRVLLDTLCNALDAGATPILLDTLLCLAQIEAKSGNFESSLKMLDHVVRHPASTQKTKARALALNSEAERLSTGLNASPNRDHTPDQSLEELLNTIIQYPGFFLDEVSK